MRFDLFFDWKLHITDTMHMHLQDLVNFARVWCAAWMKAFHTSNRAPRNCWRVRLMWNNPVLRVMEYEALPRVFTMACGLLDDTPCLQPFPKPVLTYVSVCQARTVCSPAYGRRGPASCRQIPRERGRLYRHFCACVMCSMNESISYLESCASQLLARASDVEQPRVTCNGIWSAPSSIHDGVRLARRYAVPTAVSETCVDVCQRMPGTHTYAHQSRAINAYWECGRPGQAGGLFQIYWPYVFRVLFAISQHVFPILWVMKSRYWM